MFLNILFPTTEPSMAGYSMYWVFNSVQQNRVLSHLKSSLPWSYRTLFAVNSVNKPLKPRKRFIYLKKTPTLLADLSSDALAHRGSFITGTKYFSIIWLLRSVDFAPEFHSWINHVTNLFIHSYYSLLFLFFFFFTTKRNKKTSWIDLQELIIKEINSKNHSFGVPCFTIA